MEPSLSEIIGILEADQRNRTAAVRQLNVSSAIWLQILTQRPDLCRVLALNKNLPADVLEKLAQSDDWRVRLDVAMKRAAPPQVLEALASDPDEAVRAAVAHNRKTPIHLLRNLSSDRETLVQDAARNSIAKLNRVSL
jgi:hypothetical protein